MNRKVSKALKKARADKEFVNDYLSSDPDSVVPTFYASDLHKHVFVSIYMGWMMAKGRYNELRML
jgi:hypothetical protein